MKETRDLVLPAERLSNLPPSFVANLRQCFALFDEVKSFEDLERRFLQGQGLSPRTYETYLESVKQFYDFTGGKHPLQVLPGDIEAWYDQLVQEHSRATAYLRMSGLKKFFEGVKQQVPFYESPFDLMSEKCKKKISKPPKTPKGKALTKGELRKVLDFVRRAGTLKDRQNEALMLMLVTTGLRASELCGLTWRNLEQDPDTGTWYAEGIGKGSQPFRQEVADAGAIQKARAVHRELFGRLPAPDQRVFHSLPNYHGKEPTPMTRSLLWARIREIGEKVVAAGVVKRELTWSPHLFRRTYATLLTKSGMDLVAVQQLTRHKSINTLVKHYVDSRLPAAPVFAEILA